MHALKMFQGSAGILPMPPGGIRSALTSTVELSTGLVHYTGSARELGTRKLWTCAHQHGTESLMVQITVQYFARSFQLSRTLHEHVRLAKGMLATRLLQLHRIFPLGVFYAHSSSFPPALHLHLKAGGLKHARHVKRRACNRPDKKDASVFAGRRLFAGRQPKVEFIDGENPLEISDS